jgi:hypothetical protein
MQDKILDKIDTKIDETDSAPEIKSPKKLNSANKRKMILSTQLGQVGSNNLLFNDLLNFAKGSFLDAGGSQPPQNGSQPSLFNRSSLGLGAGFGLDSKGSHTPKPRPMMPYLIETGLGDGFIIAIPLSSN